MKSLSLTFIFIVFFFSAPLCAQVNPPTDLRVYKLRRDLKQVHNVSEFNQVLFKEHKLTASELISQSSVTSEVFAEALEEKLNDPAISTSARQEFFRYFYR